MIDLAEAQFELTPSSDDGDTDGLHMGLFTSVAVSGFSPGEAAVRSADADVAMGDGVRFGRDYRSGRVLELELTAVAPQGSTQPALDALNAADALEGAWAADRVRLVPGAVQCLRWNAGGRTRRVYGRPRKIAPSRTGAYHQGSIAFTADFQCVDDLYYSDQRKVVTVPIAAAPNAWTRWPLEWPVTWYQPVTGTAGTVIVGGTRATWPTFTIHGPIAKPSIVIGGYGEIKLDVTLASDQVLYLDTRPWNRGVRRDNGQNLAGSVDVRATPLSELRLPPGSYSVALKGTDVTGTAQLVIDLRDAFSSF